MKKARKSAEENFQRERRAAVSQLVLMDFVLTYLFKRNSISQNNPVRMERGGVGGGGDWMVHCSLDEGEARTETLPASSLLPVYSALPPNVS